MPDNISGGTSRLEKIEAISAYLKKMGSRELMIVEAFCRGLMGEQKGANT